MILRHALRKLNWLFFSDYHAIAADYYRNLSETYNELVQLLGRDTNVRVLDVGCGDTYPASILYTARGWNVTGIDVDPMWRLGPWTALWKTAKSGPIAVARRLVRELFYVGRFHKQLLKAAGIKMPTNLDLRCLSVTGLPFGDGEFDVSYSMAVFEQVMEAEKGIAEMARVMKPGGIGLHVIHLFTSLSGGHDHAWEYPDKHCPKDVPPWDHLLNGRAPAIHTLNRWRERQYRECFERHFEVLCWKMTCREGERVLTPELREALSEYSENELLTRALKVVVRKPLQS